MYRVCSTDRTEAMGNYEREPSPPLLVCEGASDVQARFLPAAVSPVNRRKAGSVLSRGAPTARYD